MTKAPVLDSGIQDERPTPSRFAFLTSGPTAALAFPTYRILWFGMLGSSSVNWMEQLAHGWLILELTDSPFLLGFIGFARSIPAILFSVWGGVLADRVERKKLLMICQIVIWTNVTIMAVLTITGIVEAWHVFAAAISTGVAQAFNLPARQSMVNDAVPKPMLGNAIALNSTAFNISRVMGPSLAGIIVAVMGVKGVFIFESIVMLGVMYQTSRLSLPKRIVDTAGRGSPWQDVTSGFRYVAGNGVIRALLLLLIVPVVLAWPYQYLLPVFARDALGVGPEGLGLLMSSAGAGSLVSLVALVSAGDFKRKTLVQFAGVLGFCVFLVLFSTSRSLPLSMFFIAAASASAIVYNVLNQTLVQTFTPDEVRGRVLGIYQLIMGLNPLGSLLAGALASYYGAPATVFGMASLSLVLVSILLWRIPTLRRVRD